MFHLIPVIGEAWRRWSRRLRRRRCPIVGSGTTAAPSPDSAPIEKKSTWPRITLIRAAITLMRAAITLMRARSRQMREPISRMGVRNSQMGARIKRIRARDHVLDTRMP